MRLGVDARALAAWPAGIEVYTRNLLKGFAALGKDHEYVLYSTRDFALPCEGPFRKRLGTGLLGRKGSIWMQTEVPHLCHRDRLDLFWSPLQTLPVRLPRRIGAVLTVHDFVHYYFPKSMRFGNLVLLKTLAPPSWRRADAFITGSQHSENLIRRFLGPDREVKVIPHGHMGLGAVDRKEALEFVSRKLAIRAPYVLGVGTLEPRKNLIALIRAFASIASGAGAGFTLVLVGAKGWKYGTIFEEVERLGVADRIVFAGAVPDFELARLYAGASLFVFPSLYEGFGLPVLEAMAFGVPVACSRSSSLPEVTGDAGLLFDPGDESEMARAMARLMTDSRLAAKLVELGKARAATFGWEKAAAQTLAVFERTLARARPVRRLRPIEPEGSVFDESAEAFLSKAKPEELAVKAPTSVESSMTRDAFGHLGAPRGKPFLDFGCGHGHNAIWAAREGASISVGFDVSRSSLDVAAAKAKASGTLGRAFFVRARAERLPFKDSTFRLAAGTAVIHHVDPVLSGAELSRVMARGGKAAFTEPWSGNPFAQLARAWVAYPRKRRTRGERPLRPGDVKDFTASFKRVRTVPYYLLTALSKLARGYFAGDSLERADRAILERFPFLGPLAVQVLILLEK